MRKASITLLVALVLIVALAGAVAASGAQEFGWISAKRLSVVNDTTLSDTAVTGVLELTATSTAVSDGDEITPSAAYHQISASSEATVTLAAGDAGDLLVLTNTGAITINVEDTGTTKLTTDTVMLQYDSLTLISDGTNWIEISRADN